MHKTCRESLAKYNNAEERRGFSILSHDDYAPISKKICASKGGRHQHPLSIEQSRNRLFSAGKKLFNEERAERIRLRDLRGKTFDIVNGGIANDFGSDFDYNRYNR